MQPLIADEEIGHWIKGKEAIIAGKYDDATNRFDAVLSQNPANDGVSSDLIMTYLFVEEFR